MIFPQFLSPSRIRHEKLMLVDISCVGTYQGFQFDPLGITGAGDRGLGNEALRIFLVKSNTSRHRLRYRGRL